jgi:hypothetical protein
VADLTRNKQNTKAFAGPEFVPPAAVLKSGITVYQGGSLFRDPNDSSLVVTSPAGAPMLEARGVSTVKQTGDGTAYDLADVGLHERENSATSGEIIPATLPLGWPLYAKDNQTVSLHDGAGQYPKLGVFGGWSGNSKPQVWIGVDPYGLRELTITCEIGHADLTDADTTQEFTIYTLPGPAVVMGPPWIRSKTDFSGGGTGSATVALGIDSDPDALGDERDVFTGSAAAPAAMTAGVNGAAGYPLSAGGVIKLTAVADTTVAAFTAGAVVISLRLKPGSY